MARKRRNQRSGRGGLGSTRSSKSQQSLASESARSRKERRILTAPGRTGVGSLQFFLPVLLFFVCFGAYVSNGDFMPGNDQQGSMLASVNFLKRHTFSLSPPDSPASFVWILETPGKEPQRVIIGEWSRGADDLYALGQLKAENRYYLAKTTRPEQYVNTFGLGAAMTALPVYAFLDLLVDIETNRYWWWHGGALTASLLTALAAVCVFLAARRFVGPLPALLTALAFGLGSCVWAISSQALWQHPANALFLSLGAYFLLGIPERRRYAAYCGAALGMAVLCRPTSAIVVICVGAYLLSANRRWFAGYMLAGLPFAVILAMYNGYYFGNPFEFGQTLASKSIALASTGSEHLWQSPILESLPGLFISPSRGLVFYSPVLLFGLVGAVLVWKDRRYRPLIPLQAATLALILVAAKWFDWWGGSTYGYRPIVDTAPFFALMMIPVIDRVVSNRWMLSLFGALLLWSSAVQFVGAWSYSGTGWISQWKDYDNPDKASLWQWSRPQIAYHIANFRSERATKKRLQERYTQAGGPILSLSPRE